MTPDIHSDEAATTSTPCRAPGTLNNDGYYDLLIGAPFNDTGGIHAGAAYFVLGGAP